MTFPEDEDKVTKQSRHWQPGFYITCTSPLSVNNSDAARQLHGVILCKSVKTKNKLQVHLQVLGDFFFWQQAMHAGVREREPEFEDEDVSE